MHPAVPRTVRRPLVVLADTARGGTPPTVSRLLAETGRKPIDVAAFGSSV